MLKKSLSKKLNYELKVAFPSTSISNDNKEDIDVNNIKKEKNSYKDKDLLFVFGRNSHGELSQGHKQDIIIPTITNPPIGHQVAYIAYGYENTVLLTKSRDIFTTGSWITGTQGDPDVRWDVLKFRKFTQVKGIPFIRLACGDQHCLALSITGELYSWGGTLYGKLGTTSSNDLTSTSLPPSSSSSTPSKSNFRILDVLLKKKITEIACGREHSAVCSEDGEVYTFGNNKSGQLGHLLVSDSHIPRRVIAGDININTKAKKICCGDFFTLIIDLDKKLYSWGDNNFCQLGLEQNVTFQKVPAAVDLINKKGEVHCVSAGRGFTVVAMANGDVYSFGFGQHGQLGHGILENETRPRLISGLQKHAIVKLASGDRHTLALSDNGVCIGWGCNDRGQLGTGGHSASSIPIVIPKLAEYKIVEIGAGCSHSLAMTYPFTETSQMSELVTISNTRTNIANAVVEAQRKKSVHQRKSSIAAIEKLDELRQWELDKLKTSMLDPEPDVVYSDKVDIVNLHNYVGDRGDIDEEIRLVEAQIELERRQLKNTPKPKEQVKINDEAINKDVKELYDEDFFSTKIGNELDLSVEVDTLNQSRIEEEEHGTEAERLILSEITPEKIKVSTKHYSDLEKSIKELEDGVDLAEEINILTPEFKNNSRKSFHFVDYLGENVNTSNLEYEDEEETLFEDDITFEPTPIKALSPHLEPFEPTPIKNSLRDSTPLQVLDPSNLKISSSYESTHNKSSFEYYSSEIEVAPLNSLVETNPTQSTLLIKVIKPSQAFPKIDTHCEDDNAIDSKFKENITSPLISPDAIENLKFNIDSFSPNAGYSHSRKASLFTDEIQLSALPLSSSKDKNKSFSKLSAEQQQLMAKRLSLTPNAQDTNKTSYFLSEPVDTKKDCPLVDSFRSKHVNMVHRYVVFETDKSSSAKLIDGPDVLRALVDEYISFYSIQDKDLLFHNFVSTGSHYASNKTPSKFATPISITKKARGVKHTLLFVSRYVPNYPSFVDWHKQFFEIFSNYSSRISFTEMLPVDQIINDQTA